MRKNKPFWFLMLVCLVMVIPFLGIYDYNTKGEPRESIVSYTMLESGNWILPRNSVGEMAYKPPFFYWAVAVCSKVCGEVNEFSSRLPSAIAFVALVLATFQFYRKRRNGLLSFTAALVAFTSWELHRQGFNCRVDMVLTAFIVGALMLLYRWYERGMRGVPIWAVVMMSGAILTKGPVGALLPCLTMGIFLLCRKVNFFRVFFSMFLFGVLSLLLPALWYYAAWQQGGQEFIDLVMEENVGRMTSTMSYESCVEPWYYNFITLIIGYLPWVILALMAAFVAMKAGRRAMKAKPRWTDRVKAWWKGMDDVELFSLVTIVVIFVFYCIPQSKRSVYLMPIYPFIAYFVAKMLFWLHKHHHGVMNAFGMFLSLLGLTLVAAFIILKFVHVSPDWFHGRHGFQNYSMVLQLQQTGSWWHWAILAFGSFILVAWWHGKRNVLGLVMLVLAIYLQFNAAYKPPVLNGKSVRNVAAKVEELVPEGKGDLYEFIEAGVLAKGDPVHYFEMNFYLHDRIGNFHTARPDKGYLIIGTEDAERWLPKFGQEGYRFNRIYDSGAQRVAGQPMLLLAFEK